MHAVRRGWLVVAVVGALVLPTAAPAGAVEISPPVAEGLVLPLGLAVGSDGTTYISETPLGRLDALTRKGTSVVATEGAAEIAGMHATGRGTLVYTTSNATEEEPATTGSLKRVLPNGRTTVLADLLAYEEAFNPDAVNTYGAVGLTPECAEGLPWFVTPYEGVVEVHPYAVTAWRGGWVVADAAANALLEVRPDGRVSTLAVLPPQESVITAAQADEVGLPDCVVGKTYRSEPVPTDVELGRDGLLYVSLLAGGIAPGAVYTVDPRSGATTLLGSGFAGATDLAVADDGRVYVAELFAGRVSEVVAGGPATVASVPFPGALEWSDGHLVAAVDVFGDGKIVTITP